MDCPAEERMIRLALADLDEVASLDFDFSRRRVVLIHRAPVGAFMDPLQRLGLGARVVGSEGAPGPRPSPAEAGSEGRERRTLWILLAINGLMFVAEMILGWWAQSTGLMADALDMLADAAVYGISLAAVGRAAKLQVRAAHASGWLQMALAMGAVAEILRRFATGSHPEPAWMVGVSVVALIANLSCLALISGHRGGGAHMRASWIFSTNDVLANLGVIAAALLVGWTRTNLPDLVIGTVIAAVVFGGAVRILRLR